MTATSRKIFFLVTHSSAGGAQEVWANLAESFRERGHDVQLLALYPLRQDVRLTSEHLPWRYVAEAQPRSPLAAATLLKRLVGLIRRERPAYIFTAMPAANVIGAVAAKLAGTGTRVINSHHSPPLTHSGLTQRLDRFTGTLSNVDAIVCVSRAVAQQLDDRSSAYRRKRVIIHNALPPAVERQLGELQQQRNRRTDRPPTLVATGRLSPEKNYPTLLQAMRNMPRVQAVIIGTGSEESRLRQLAQELGVADRVDFLGLKPRREALELLAGGDVFVQVSLFEGHSLALIEAAKLHLPLVVSDAAGQVEGVTSADGTPCGIIVPALDAGRLAVEVTQLFASPEELQHWSRLAAKLGAEATYATMITAYERLVLAA